MSLEELLDIEISTAAKYGQTSREAAASITVVTAEEIERYGYRTLEDVFTRVRGLYLSDDRNYAYVGIRGFSRPTDYNSRVLLLLNGTSFNENVFGSASIGTALGLNLDAVERIEIVRGPGSALYGTNAMFAVVNVITRTGNAVDGLRLSADAGSFGTRTGRAMYGRQFANGLDIAVAGQWWRSAGQDHFYRGFDDPETDGGVAEDLDWDDHYGVTASTTYGDLSLHGHFASRKKGIPTASYGVDFNDPRSETLDELGLVGLRYDRQIRAGQNLMLRSHLNYYNSVGGYPYDGLLSTEDARGDWLGNEVQYIWATHPNNLLTFGAEYQDHSRAEYTVTEEGLLGVYAEGSSTYNILSFYVQDELQVSDRLSLTLGVRRDRYSTVGSTITPRAALVCHPLESAIFKLLYGEAFRAPSAYEATYEEEDYAKPNPDLAPEEIRTTEAVWEQQLSDSILGTAIVYHYRMQDLLDLAIDPADGLQQYQNVNRVDARGVELGLTMRRESGLHGYASYAFQAAEDAASDRRLTNYPSHIGKGGLSYPFTRSLSAASALRYESGRSTVFGRKTEPFLLTDVTVSARRPSARNGSLGSLYSAVRVSLSVHNLFDVRYSTPGGIEHRQPAIRQNGRSILLRVDHEL
jgi:outer membrane receptor for ferrienterochelin and colicins